MDEVERLIAELRDTNRRVRENAADALGKICDVRAVEPLITALTDSDKYVRRNAAGALGNIGDARAVEPLVAALHDVYLGIRLKSVEALGKIGKPSVDPLIAALRDPHLDITENVAEVLGNIGDDRAVCPLIHLLKHGPDWWAKKAASALGKIGKPAVDPLVSALRYRNLQTEYGFGDRAMNALAEIGKPAAVPLIDVLRDLGPHDVIFAVEALGRIGDDHAVEPLIAKLHDSWSDIRYKAAEALGMIGDARAVDPLITVLGDSDSDVRDKAAEALGMIGDARAVEPLVALLRNDVGWWTVVRALVKIGDTQSVEPLLVARLAKLYAELHERNKNWRIGSARELGRIGDARAVEPLIASLRDYDSEVRYTAAFSLGEIGDARAVEPLIAALRDSDLKVRRVAAHSLGKIGDARAVEPLIAALRDSGEYLYMIRNYVPGLPRYPLRFSSNALWALGKIDPAWAESEVALKQLSGLIAALRDSDSSAMRYILDEYYPAWADSDTARQQVPELIVTLRDSNSADVRKNAAWVLEDIGDARAVEQLIAALRDSNSDVRRLAVNALGKIGDVRAVEPLIAVLGDADWQVRGRTEWALGNIGKTTLVKIGKTAIMPLLVALDSADVDVRKDAEKALLDIGKLAIEPLIAALRDSNWHVRQNAKEMLDKIDPTWPQSVAALQQLPAFLCGLRWYNYSYLSTILKQILSKTTVLPTLLSHYPYLYCQVHYLRSEKKHVRIGLLRWKAIVRCRGCQSLADLITNVRVAVGFVGGDGEDLAQQGDTVHVRLWDEATGQPRNADIDRLLIRHGGVEQYDLAIDKLINTLKNDTTRPLRWCKKIPIEVEAGVRLPVGAMTMLKDTFKSVSTLSSQ